MFPRRKRLTREDFIRLSREKRFHSRHFSLIISPKVSGYAVVVSKKTAKLSTARHLLKRRVLAALRSLPLPPAVVVFAKDSATALSFAEIKTELATLLT
ncbi:MAG: ribonuclease P protein component [bacterium]|nr:ribonuclease P protein component [bacterium]